jgi:outer membrane protein, heavy metal efflux system
VPDVSLSLGYAQQGTTNQAVTPPTWTLGLSLPLPIFYQQQGEVRRAEADRRTQALALAKTEASVVSDVEQAWSAYTSSRALLERMEGGLLERARTARDLVTIQYQKGAAGLLDLLDAQRTFIAIRVEYLQQLAGYWNAVFRLEQAAGMVLR